jgi:glucan 1,3-beta-glucosidase
MLAVHTAVALLLGAGGVPAASPDADLPWIRTSEDRFVNAAGEPVLLRGCNLGNWLLLEMWMLAVDEREFPDQHAFETNLVARFGEEEKNRLMQLYRANWITPRDFDVIRSFSFNVVRVPFDHRLVEDEEHPGT